MYGLDSSSVSLLGFGAVVVVGAVIMYLVSLVSMKETSFEDVLEEQRRKKAKEDKERTLANKQKREQYKKKLNLKKKKTAIVADGKTERVDSGASPMHEVQIKETPKIESVEPVAAPEPKKPKAKAAKKQQEPPVQPKEDTPKPPSHPIPKLAPEKPKLAPEKPKPAPVKLKQEATPVVPARQTATDAKDEAQKKKQDSGRIHTVSLSDDVQEIQKAEVEQEKVKKKKKKEVEAESEIVRQLREVPLSDRDVQNILTMMKQKYEIDVGGGTKIKDLQRQLDNAKKQLAQSENNLQQYVSRCMSAEKKIEQLKQDFMEEKTKVTSLEKALQDADNEHKQEVATVQSRQATEIKQLQDRVAVAADYEELCKTVDTMKTEKIYLVEEISKNASVVAEKNRLSGDLQQLTQKLQEAQRRFAELEAHQQQESNSTKLLEQVTALQTDNEAKAEAHRVLEQRLAGSKQLLGERDAQIKDVTKQNTDLLPQLQNLERQVAQLNSQIIQIEKETKDKAASDTLTEDAEQINKLQRELESIVKEKTILKADVDRLKKKNNDLRDRGWKAMDTVSNLEKALKDKVAAAKADGDVRCAHLETTVKESLKESFPGISINEENFEAWVRRFASQASESSQTVQSTVESSGELEETRDEVQKLRHKLESISDNASGLKSRILELETSTKEIQEEKDGLQKDSQQKQEELSNAVTECEKYKNILNSTEEVLRNLQSSVEVEEGVWRKKVEDAHEQASKAHQDAEDLRKTVEELKSEKLILQSNVKEEEELRKQLEEVTSEVSALKEQSENAKTGQTDGLQQTENIVHDDVGDVAESAISPDLQVDTQKQPEDAPTTSVSGQFDSQVQDSDACAATIVQQHQDAEGFLVIEQVDVREERLEKEKTLTKNLGQAATKLQSVLKQTQEQLKEEREKSSELENKPTADIDVKENSDSGQTEQKMDDGDGTCV